VWWGLAQHVIPWRLPGRPIAAYSTSQSPRTYRSYVIICLSQIYSLPLNGKSVFLFKELQSSRQFWNANSDQIESKLTGFVIVFFSSSHSWPHYQSPIYHMWLAWQFEYWGIDKILSDIISLRINVASLNTITTRFKCRVLVWYCSHACRNNKHILLVLRHDCTLFNITYK
jgi:hypothetical protein